MSIRLRLTLWYSGILAITLLLFCAVLYLYLSLTLHNQAKTNLLAHSHKVYERIEVGLFPTLWGLNLDIQLNDMDTYLSDKYYLQIVNLMQKKKSRSSNAIEDQIDIPFNELSITELQEKGAFYETVEIRGHPFIVYNEPLFLRGIEEKKMVGVLQVAIIESSYEFLDTLRATLLLFSLITILLAASIGWFFARAALKPIDDVITAADQIEKGTDLDKRIIYDGPDDEIGRLIHKINGMLARIQTMYSDLEDAYRTQRRFVSDASHELRTPLTTIRGNVDLLKKVWEKTTWQHGVIDQSELDLSLESVKDIADEAERMSRLVSDLLSLARADAGYEMVKEPVAMLPMLEEVIRRAQFLPRNVQWLVGNIHPLETVEVYGNKDYLQQLLFIFIENAFKFTNNGYVQIDALIHDEGEQVGIRISDSGMGMNKQDVPQIFNRFYRADPSRGQTAGTGLGLSIARWIIDEHHGSIEVTTRLDEGSTFIIWLPMLRFASPSE